MGRLVIDRGPPLGAASFSDFDSYTFAESSSILTSGGGHEPTDVLMTQLVYPKFETEAVGTVLQNAIVYEGVTARATGHMVIRDLSASQASWNGGTAMPVPPSGGHVLVTQIPNGNTAADFGRLEKSGTTSKTVYIRAVHLIGDTFQGAATQEMKLFQVFVLSGLNNFLFDVRGSGTGNKTMGVHLQNTNKDGTYINNQSTSSTLVLNTFNTVEAVVAQSSSNVAADGHFTVWVNSIKTYQLTGIIWQASNPNLLNFGEVDHLHLWGTSPATVPADMWVATDEYYVSTSPSRCALPA